MGLDARISIGGFFCLVRGDTDYVTAPQWWFSHPELETFLTVSSRRWDTTRLGTLVEAFVVAGGSVRKVSSALVCASVQTSPSVLIVP